MYAVEFETAIDTGVVHVPEQYKELQKSKGRYPGRRIYRTINQATKTTRHADIAGKLNFLGDIFSSAPESDWSLPK